MSRGAEPKKNGNEMNRPWPHLLLLLFLSAASRVAAYGGFTTSESLHAETENLTTICRNEAGSGARLADWGDLTRYYEIGGSLNNLIDALTWSGSEGLLLSNGQEYFNSTANHYYVVRHDGHPPAGFTAHSNLSGNTIDLGSGAGLSQRVLCYKTPPSYTLTITKPGLGTGTVDGVLAGINCGSVCGANYPEATIVTLTARAAAGSTFTGWSGACSGTQSSCSVTMTQARSVAAAFYSNNAALTVTKAGTGSGTVGSYPAGINCGSTCSSDFFVNSSVTLAATPAAGSVFIGWTGACSGSTCTVSMAGAQNVTAIFGSLWLGLGVTKAGTGSGTVTSSPAIIDCGSTCSGNFANGSSVTLTAIPAAGSIFTGWSGACSGTIGSCTVAMSEARSVTSNFARGAFSGFTATASRNSEQGDLGGICGAEAGADYQLADWNDLFAYYQGGGSLTSLFSALSWNTSQRLLVSRGSEGYLSGTSRHYFVTRFDGQKPGEFQSHADIGSHVVDLGSSYGLSERVLCFQPQPSYPLAVRKVGSGSGTVAANAGGLSCAAADCNGSFSSGASVALTATPNAGSVFAGWSGAGCTGIGSCVVDMSAGREVVAGFRAQPFAVATTGVTDRLITAATATVTATIQFKAADVGRVGGIFVTAWVPRRALGTAIALAPSAIGGASTQVAANARDASDNFVLVQLTSAGWTVVENGNLISYTSNVLGEFSSPLPIITLAGTATLAGAQFCVGYGVGRTQAEVVANFVRNRNMYPVAYVGESAPTVAGMGSCDTSAANRVPFTGRRGEYRLGRSGTDTIVTDQVANRDGTVTVGSTPDHLVFSDMSVNLGVAAAALAIDATGLQRIEELYLAFFNRVPDADGLSYWIERYQAGQSLNQIAESFYNIGASAQFAALTGFSPGMTDADFIHVFYRNVLGRAEGADAGGLAYWNTKLASGTSTRSSLGLDIIATAHTFKGDATYGWVADLLDNKVTAASQFAINLGLTYISTTDSFTQGKAIAAAVTPTSVSAALALIGVSDGALAAPPEAPGIIRSYQLTGSQMQDGGRSIPTIPDSQQTLAIVRPAIAVGPLSGLWWNPAEPGWGINVIQHDATNFVVIYSFDSSGKPTWYAMSNCPVVGMRCSGDIYRVSGGTPPTWHWNGEGLTVSPVGSGTLNFADANNATYSFSLDGRAGTSDVTRRAFATDTSVPNINYTDLWTTPGEPGWGVTLIQQFGMIFAAVHTYDPSGQPTWYVVSSCPLVSDGCAGDLYQVDGGYPLTALWYGTIRATRVGAISFTFADASNGAMRYSINGVTASRRITRQLF